MTEPIAETESEGRPGQDLDGLLTAFFRAEMPQPWPEFQAPVNPAPARMTVSRRPVYRSRVALAASLLLLLIGQFCLSGLYSERPVVAPDATPSALEATNRERPAHWLKAEPKGERAKDRESPARR